MDKNKEIELEQNSHNQNEMSEKETNEKKEISKSKVLFVVFVIFVLLATTILLVAMKTTFIASLAACIQEKPSESTKYISFRIFSENQNYASYKDEVVLAIRTDKATALREEQIEVRTQKFHDVLVNYSSIFKDVYAYETERKEEKDTSKDYQQFIGNLKIDLDNQREIDATKELIDLIADSVHYAMSVDAIYKNTDQNKVADTMEEFIDRVNNSKAVEDFYMEQIEPGEYDPQPERGLGSKYKDSIKLASKNNGEAAFDYISELNLRYNDPGDKEVIGIHIVSVVGENAYAILETKINISDQYKAQLSCGTIRPYTNNDIILAEVPFVINEQEMQNKAQKFVDDFKKALTLDGKLLSYYDAYLECLENEYLAEHSAENKEPENAEVAEVTEETSGENEEKMNTVIDDFNSGVDELVDSVEAQYDISSEWGSVVFLEEYIQIMKVLVTDAVLDQLLINHPDLISDEISEEEKQDLISNVENRNKFMHISQIECVNEKMVKDLDLSAFNTNYPIESGNDIPEVLMKKIFTYKIDELGDMDVSVILTPQGSFLTNVKISWMKETSNENESVEAQENPIMADQNVELFNKPNLLRMMQEAKENIDPNAYEDNEAYELAVARWLHNNYPDYFGNPDQNPGGASGSSRLYFTSTIDKIIQDTKWNVHSIYEDLGYAMEGSLFGYLLTDNGSYSSFTDDVSDVVSDVKDGIKDFWWDLWH